MFHQGNLFLCRDLPHFSMPQLTPILGNVGVLRSGPGDMAYRSVHSAPVSAPPPIPPRVDLTSGQGLTPSFGLNSFNGMGGGYGLGGFGGLGYGGFGGTGFGGGGGYGSAFGGGGYGMGMGHGHMPGHYGGYSFMPGANGQLGFGDIESRFIQLAEENSRPAFNSIQSLVTAVGSVAMMLENTFFALTSSFRAILGVAENFGRLRSLFAQFWSTFAAVRTLNWIVRKLMVLIGVRTEDEFKAWAEAMAGMPDADGTAEKPATSSWPMLLFFGVVAAAPYIVLRMMNSITNSINENLNDPTTWQTPLHGIVRHNFTATAPNELSINTAHTITLAPQHLQGRLWNSGWLMASTDGRKAGLVPVTYIKLIKPTEPGQATPIPNPPTQSILPTFPTPNIFPAQSTLPNMPNLNPMPTMPTQNFFPSQNTLPNMPNLQPLPAMPTQNILPTQATQDAATAELNPPAQQAEAVDTAKLPQATVGEETKITQHQQQEQRWDPMFYAAQPLGNFVYGVQTPNASGTQQKHFRQCDPAILRDSAALGRGQHADTPAQQRTHTVAELDKFDELN